MFSTWKKNLEMAIPMEWPFSGEEEKNESKGMDLKLVHVLPQSSMYLQI